MTTLPLHPAAVHVPLGLAIVLPLVAIAVALLALRRAPPRGALVLLAALQALLFASGLVASQLGERDEDRVERVAGEAAIERHEERAELFVWGAGIVLAVAGAVLVLPASGRRAGLAAFAAGTVAVAALAYRTGEAGGELVYASGGAAAWRAEGVPAPGAAAPAVAEHDDDD